MTDNYQAVYDAVRSRFHCSIDGNEIANSIASMFDSAGQAMLQAGYSAQTTEDERQRPSVLFRPTLPLIAGQGWRAKYGDLTAYGASPVEAMAAFDAAWKQRLAGADKAEADTHKANDDAL